MDGCYASLRSIYAHNKLSRLLYAAGRERGEECDAKSCVMTKLQVNRGKLQKAGIKNVLRNDKNASLFSQKNLKKYFVSVFL